MFDSSCREAPGVSDGQEGRLGESEEASEAETGDSHANRGCQHESEGKGTRTQSCQVGLHFSSLCIYFLKMNLSEMQSDRDRDRELFHPWFTV